MAIWWITTALLGHLSMSVAQNSASDNCPGIFSGINLRSQLNQTAHWLGNLEVRSYGILESHLEPMVVDVQQERRKCGENHLVVIRASFEGPPVPEVEGVIPEYDENDSQKHISPPSNYPNAQPPRSPPTCKPPPPKQCPPTPTPTTCPEPKMPLSDGYEFYSGRGFYKIHRELLKWAEAQAICELEGAHLAIIDSEEERDIFVSLPSRHSVSVPRSAIYLGFHDRLNEGYFVTVLGQPVSQLKYQDWASGQPDNYQGNEDCGAMTMKGQLNDIPCDFNQPFICELEVQ